MSCPVSGQRLELSFDLVEPITQGCESAVNGDGAGVDCLEPCPDAGVELAKVVE